LAFNLEEVKLFY